MSVFSKNKNLQFLALFLVVFLSRVPFLSAGYGVEEDSWGIVLAVFHTKLTGIYEPSRFPGHPVQELVYLALWNAGPIVYNGLCALFSAIATLFFALILQHLNFKYVFLAALAFAFTPVFYISSTYTIDFVWSEAFVLISLYCLFKNKLLLTGIFLGLAIGCRITCGAMLIPFMIILWQNNYKKNIVSLLKIIIPMCAMVLIAFIPLFFQFGTNFFMYYDQFPYPPITKVLYKMTFGVFGIVGLVGIAIALTSIVLNKHMTKGLLFENKIDRKIIIACFTIIILYVISYLRLPQKSGYMISIIPFMILLFGYYLNEQNFKMLCYTLIAASFICGFNLTDKIRGAEYSKLAATFQVSGQEVFFDPLSGPVFLDYSKREQKIRYTNEVINKVKEIDFKTVIISGWWYNEIMVTTFGQIQNDNVIFASYIDEDRIKKYINEGYEITYLPEQNIYNDQMFKMNFTNIVAKPF